MVLTRKQMLDISECIRRIKEKNITCSISLKYRILKIEQAMSTEVALTKQLIDELILKYAEVDEKGNPIIENGGVSIKKDEVAEVQQEISDFYEITCSIPDTYFTIEELETLELDWKEAESLLPLVKN